MRQSLVVLLLVLGSVAALLLMTGGATAAEDTEYGPRDWAIGMEWAWSNATGSEEMRVHDHRELATPSGRYDTWMTRSHRSFDDGTEHLRITSWVQGSHRRVHDEIHIYRPGEPQMMVSTTYSPPTAFPMWETIGPGSTFTDGCERVKTTTRYMVGSSPAGGESHTWEWCAWGDGHVYNLTTPAGTFEGFNVTVYKEEVEGDNSSRYRYFYSHEARNFVATLDGAGEPDFTLDSVTLLPPPVARGFVDPAIAEVGEPIDLYGHRSHARTGNLTSIEWVLPNGTHLPGPNATATFDEAGRKTIRLSVTDSNDRTSTIPLSVRVIERTPNFKIAGPRHAVVEEDTSFRLVAPEDREIRRATWRAPDVPTQSGTTVELVFPQPGRYNITVTFVDREGTTGRASHVIRVVEGSGSTATNGTATDGGFGSEAPDLVPAILSPENNTRLGERQALVVARVTSLEDPALVLGNGLRVPMDSEGTITSAQVPLSGETTTIQLVDGHKVVDQVTLQYAGSGSLDGDDAQANGATDTNSTPFPWLAPILTIPLLRRRER